MESIAFEFATATKIVFGKGALSQIGGIVKSFGSRVLIVTGKNTERAKPLTAILEKQNLSVNNVSS
jgi:alcohol dehydrogenase YqhD (iron-dependent ADH family)